MEKQELVAYLLHMLRSDYGFWVCAEEQPLLVLKLYVALEQVEHQAKQESVRRVRCTLSLN